MCGSIRARTSRRRYSVNYLQPQITPLTPDAGKDIERLRATLGPSYDVVSRTYDDREWIVVVDDPVHALSTYLYDRDSGQVTKLFDQRPELTAAPLQPMHARARSSHATARCWCRISRCRAGSDPSAHRQAVAACAAGAGRAWRAVGARCSMASIPSTSGSANRGYAVLAVNFRGSTGFGKSFMNAGDREWGRKMHEDLLDAVDWAVREKNRDSLDKVAIYGGSYGGYAVLAALTMTPDKFACGPRCRRGRRTWKRCWRSIPPYWKAFYEDLARRVGDPRTEEGRKLLKERSPLTYADRIQRPLLIAQGANDPRVKQAEADQIVSCHEEPRSSP